MSKQLQLPLPTPEEIREKQVTFPYPLKEIFFPHKSRVNKPLSLIPDRLEAAINLLKSDLVNQKHFNMDSWLRVIEDSAVITTSTSMFAQLIKKDNVNKCDTAGCLAGSIFLAHAFDDNDQYIGDTLVPENMTSEACLRQEASRVSEYAQQWLGADKETAQWLFNRNSLYGGGDIEMMEVSLDTVIEALENLLKTARKAEQEKRL